MVHLAIPAAMAGWLWWLFLAVFADVAFGILTSLAKQKFSLAFVDNFLKTHILGRVVPVLILLIVAVGNSAFQPAFYIACGTAYASLLGEIVGKLGLPIGSKLRSAIDEALHRTPEAGAK